MQLLSVWARELRCGLRRQGLLKRQLGRAKVYLAINMLELNSPRLARAAGDLPVRQVC